MADAKDILDEKGQKPKDRDAKDDHDAAAHPRDKPGAADDEAEPELDAKFLERAERWAEEFNPDLTSGAGIGEDSLVLGAAPEDSPPPSERANNKARTRRHDKSKGQDPGRSATPEGDTNVVEFADTPATPAPEPRTPMTDAGEPLDAAEGASDVEQLLAYGESLADRFQEATAADAVPKTKGKSKSKKSQAHDADLQSLLRSGASAADAVISADEAAPYPKEDPIEPEIVTDERQGLMRWDEAINLEAQVEAILFATPKPIAISEIAQTLADDDGDGPEAGVIDAIVQQLLRLYKERNGGFRLEYDKGAGYQFRTVPAAAPIMEKMFSSRQRPLSRAAHETLAIIAYRQPCTRADIEFIRGVDAGSIIKNLLERDLVACVGRKEDSGRPMLFGTTTEFMRVFRIQSLNDLPPLSAFQPASAAILDAFQKIEQPDYDIDVEDFIGDDGRTRPQVSTDLSSDFAKSGGVFEVRGDGSESIAQSASKVRRSGGIFDNEGFPSDGHENTEVAFPVGDSLAERSGEDASRGPDQHQRQGGARAGDKDPT